MKGHSNDTVSTSKINIAGYQDLAVKGAHVRAGSDAWRHRDQ